MPTPATQPDWTKRSFQLGIVSTVVASLLSLLAIVVSILLSIQPKPGVSEATTAKMQPDVLSVAPQQQEAQSASPIENVHVAEDVSKPATLVGTLKPTSEGSQSPARAIARARSKNEPQPSRSANVRADERETYEGSEPLNFHYKTE